MKMKTAKTWNPTARPGRVINLLLILLALSALGLGAWEVQANGSSLPRRTQYVEV